MNGLRVAFSGTHRTGKTTLVDALSDLMPAYTVVDEPYRQLEEEGDELADPPSIDDYERQLRRSIDSVLATPANAFFDRCPLDFVAYLQAIDDDFDVDPWLNDLRDSIARLDLIVVVPIETPDRIVVAAHEDRQLRRRVDERLKTLALDDPYGFEATTLELSGPTDARVRQVMRAMQAGSPARA